MSDVVELLVSIAGPISCFALGIICERARRARQDGGRS